MANETKPQLFIMDEWLGDPIPLAEIKEISEPTLDEEYDIFGFNTEIRISCVGGNRTPIPDSVRHCVKLSFH